MFDTFLQFLSYLHEQKVALMADKEMLVVEYLKIYFQAHPEKVPEDTDQAFSLFQKLHKKYKVKFIADFKEKSEKFVDKYMDDKKDTYY